MLKKQNKAQSLIETIVALGIIITAVVAILSVGLAHTILGGESAERVMATNLAREGIEIIVAIAQSNHLDPTAVWPYGVENGTWVLDYNDTELLLSANDTEIVDCTNCYLARQVNDLHTTSADVHVFRRSVTISTGDDLGGNCTADCEKKIVSQVYWTEKGRPHNVSLELRLTDWQSL